MNRFLPTPPRETRPVAAEVGGKRGRNGTSGTVLRSASVSDRGHVDRYGGEDRFSPAKDPHE